MEEENTISPVHHQSDNQSSTPPPVKRRKVSLKPASMTDLEKESQLADLGQELGCLFKYYNQELHEKDHLKETDAHSFLIHSVLACLLEERPLSYSKLVADIYEKLKGREGVTLGFVRSSILDIGQRKLYGIVDADVDFLEDEKEQSLGCWETKSLKLIPEIHHADLKTRRFCRKKIQERIKAVAGMIEAIQKPDSNVDFNQEYFIKSSKESDIRMLVEQMAGRYKKEMEINFKVNEVKKELEAKTREAEKERKQDYKVILQEERELKRFVENYEKEAKRQEREVGQMRKKIKKLQEEAEKKSRKWEKELADVRQRVSCVRQRYALDKQALMMERLAKGRRGGSSTTTGPTSPVAYGTPPNSEPEDTTTPTSLTSSLDRYAST